MDELSNLRNEMIEAATARDTWPRSSHDCPEASGINCMLVLLKNMVPLLGKAFWQQIGMDQDPFIRQAWIDLSNPITANGELDRFSRAVWNMPFGQLPSSDKAFHKIMSCSHMERFWSADFCHPWRQHFWKLAVDNSWLPISSDQTPKSIIEAISSARLTVTREAFHMQAYPGMKLEKMVRDRFGYIAVQNYRVVFPALPSAFFFATFTVCQVSNKKLEFDQFRTFEMKVVHPGQAVRQRVRFNLLAIIKYPRILPTTGTAAGGETIRVYSEDGIPEPPRAPNSSYANPAWKLADMENGDVFFAVYAKAWFPPVLDPPFPETAAEMPNVMDHGALSEILELEEELQALAMDS